MNLDELVKEVNERVETHKGLVDESRSAANELYLKSKSNFETLCKDRLRTLKCVIDKINAASDKSLGNKNLHYSVKNNGVVEMASIKNNYWDIDSYFCCKTNYSAVEVKLLYERFGTEEKALSSLGEIEGLFCTIFERQIERLDGINQSLADTLQELTSLLKESSCVEEKEDGKVEIHLNGRTYVGTVKEN